MMEEGMPVQVRNRAPILAASDCNMVNDLFLQNATPIGGYLLTTAIHSVAVGFAAPSPVNAFARLTGP